jgi:hypothetical protein
MEIAMNTPLDPVNPPANLMDLMQDDQWLQGAVEIEDELDCDVAAGLGNSSKLGEVLRSRLGIPANVLNHDKLVSFLQEELGESLPSDDLEVIASELQMRVRERLQRRQSA